MTTGNEELTPAEGDGATAQPNVSPELQDAIRSIDAIGENAWGKDDDQDAPRRGDSPDPSLRDNPDDNPDGNPDVP